MMSFALRGVRKLFALMSVALTLLVVGLSQPAYAQTTPPVVVVVSPVRVMEGNSGTTNVTVTISLASQSDFSTVVAGPGGVPFTLMFSRGTATPGTDYDDFFVSSASSIPAGASSTTAVVAIRGDTVPEADETFVIEARPTRSGDGGTLGVVTIINDDEVPAPVGGLPNLSISDARLVEGSSGTTGLAIFTVSLSSPAPAGGVTYSWTTVNGTATAGADYTARTVTNARIAPGGTGAQLFVTVLGDNVQEPNENFFVDISAVTGATVVDGRGVGVIVTDDASAGQQPTLNLSGSSAPEGNSGTTDLIFTATLTQPAGVGGVTFSVNQFGGTASAFDDFRPLATQPEIFIPEGETRATIAFPVLGDTFPETDETVQLRINPNFVRGAFLGTANAFSTIVNDDGPPAVVSLSGGTSVSEGDIGSKQVVITASLSHPAPFGGLTVPLSLPSSTGPGIAEVGSDFDNGTIQELGIEVRFAAGSTTAQTTVNIIGDTVFEPDENLPLAVAPSRNPSTPYSAGVPTTITIVNDDSAILPVSVGDVSQAEGTGGTTTFNFPVTLRQPAGPNGVSFLASTVAQTAVAGSDFIALNRVAFTIPAGASTATVPVTVTGDATIEGSETFQLVLDNLVGVVSSAVPSAIGTIVNDDGSIPQLSVSDVSRREGSGGTTFFDFPILLSAPAPVGGVELSLNLTPVTAQAGSDYAALTQTRVTIPAGSQAVVVSVSVVADTVLENDETFQLTVSPVVAGQVVIMRGTATGTILDDDNAQLLISIADFIANEGDSGTTSFGFLVSLNRPAPPGGVRFDFITEDATAIAGSDYTRVQLSGGAIPPGPTFIPEGSSSAIISVPVLGDTSNEADETFTARIFNIVGATAQRSAATGRIINDDAPPIVSVEDISVREGNTGQTNAVFTVTLNKPAPAGGVRFDAQTSVSLSGQSSPTTPGSDFTPVNLTGVLIPQGSLSATVSVPIFGDVVVEDNERVTLTISNVNGASIGRGSAAATIMNDDVLIYSIASASVVEGDAGSSTLVRVEISRPPNEISGPVNFNLFGVTARAGTDFFDGGGGVFFLAGQVRQQGLIVVTGDDIVEPDETFSVVLQQAPGAFLGANNSATVTILNDDFEFIVTPTTIPAGRVGTAYNQVISVTGGTAPYTFELALGALPPGMTLQPNGTLTGTPTAGGVFPIGIAILDSMPGPVGPVLGGVAYTLTIEAAQVTLPPTSLPTARLAQAYNVTLNAATGGTAPYRYVVTGGALPTGVSLNAETGALTGTPTQTGSFSFTVTATDSSTGTGPYATTRTYGLQVLGEPPTVADSALTVPYNAAPTTVPLSLSGSAATSVAIVTVPPNGSVGVNGTTITYQPRFGFAGTDSFTYTATGPEGTSIPATVTITVEAPVFTVTTVGDLAGVVGTPYSLTVEFAGGTAPFADYAFTGLPPGVSVTGSTTNSVTISGTPTQAGSFSIEASARDSSTGNGPFRVSGTFTVAIAEQPPIASASTLSVAYNAAPTPVPLALSGGRATSVALVTAPANGSVGIEGTRIIYQPRSGFSGTDSFTYTASNAGGTSAPATVTVTVRPPEFTVTAVGELAGTAGVPFSLTFEFAGGTAPFSFYQVTGLPAGVSITGTTATSVTVSGTPTAVGSFAIEATARDSSTGDGPFTVTGTATLTMAPPVLVLQPGSPALSATYATAFSQVFTASGGSGAFNYVQTGTLPPGLTFNAATGTLSGTPTASGSYSFTITATDRLVTGVGAPFSVSRTYTVAIAAPVITVTPTTLPGATAGRAYSATLVAAGAVGPYSFTLVDGRLPPGITLSSAGVLSGTPTSSGSFPLALRVRDANGETGTVNLTITVAVPTLTITPAVLPEANQGLAYTQTITASGGIAPYSYAVSAGALPEGLTLNATTGVISGTPLGSGAASFTITVTDSTGGTPARASVAYVLQIAARPDPARDPEVQALTQSQVQSARRLSDAQIGNFRSRLGWLRPGNGGGSGGGSGSGSSGGASLASGGGFQNSVRIMAMDPCAPQANSWSVSPCARALGSAGVHGLSGFGAGPFQLSVAADGTVNAAAGAGDGSAGGPPPATGGTGVERPWSVWASGTIRYGDVDPQTGVASQSFEADGLTLGADYRYSDRLAVGVGLGFGNDIVTVGTNGSRSRTQAVTAATYGSYLLGGGYFTDWVVGYQWLDLDLQRYVTSTGSLIRSRRSGTQLFLSASAGADVDVGSWRISPYGRFDIARGSLDAYRENSGSLFDLSYGEQTLDYAAVGVGSTFRTVYAFEGGQFLPQLSLEYLYDLDRQEAARVGYVERSNGAFSTIALTGIDREQLSVGLGFEVQWDTGSTVGLDYLTRFSSGIGSDETWQLNARFQF